MSSFYDRWFRIAQHCAEQRVEPTLACEMHRQRLHQAQAYYTWVSRRRDARKTTPSPDPMVYPDEPLLRTDWFYANALEEIVGPLPREGGLYSWAEAALDRLEQLSITDLYGSEGTTGWSDWTPWGIFALMVVQTLHTFGHFVGRKTRYCDNPYSFDYRIPDWTDADKWCREHEFPV
jgi:hypothetical protein